MGEGKVTAADLRAAKWAPSSFASGSGFHMRDFGCAEYPRVTFRIINRSGEPERQTMLVDGKDVGGSEAAADVLNAPLPAPPEDTRHDEA